MGPLRVIVDDGSGDAGLGYDGEAVTWQGQPFTGVSQSYYDDGTPESSTVHWRGLKHGPQCWWYSNGQLKLLAQSFRGMDFGAYEKWHANGQVAERGRVAFGTVLEYVRFDELGRETARKSLGCGRRWQREAAQLRAGMPDAPAWLDEVLGPRGAYGPEPALLAPLDLPAEEDRAPDWATFVGPLRVTVEDDDDPASGLWRDADDNLIGEGDRPFTGVVLDSYPDGQVEARSTYWRGMRHGPSLRWYRNGQMSHEGACFRGGAFGPFVDWHVNGQVAEQGYCLFAQRLEWIKFDEQGREIGRGVRWDDAAIRRDVTLCRERWPEAPAGLDSVHWPPDASPPR